jgi:hypothetical protein
MAADELLRMAVSHLVLPVRQTYLSQVLAAGTMLWERKREHRVAQPHNGDASVLEEDACDRGIREEGARRVLDRGDDSRIGQVEADHEPRGAAWDYMNASSPRYAPSR